jgi:hypothetical protein
MSQPGDWQHLELIGRIGPAQVLRDGGQACLLVVEDGDPSLHIAVWWPPEVCRETLRVGDRIWVKGRLAVEDSHAWHRKAMHYVMASHLAVVRRAACHSAST